MRITKHYLYDREKMSSIMWLVFSGIHLASAIGVLTGWLREGISNPGWMCYFTVYGVWFLIRGFSRRRLRTQILSSEYILLSEYGYSKKNAAAIISLVICCFLFNPLGIAGFRYDLTTHQYIKNQSNIMDGCLPDCHTRRGWAG